MDTKGLLIYFGWKEEHTHKIVGMNKDILMHVLNSGKVFAALSDCYASLRHFLNFFLRDSILCDVFAIFLRFFPVFFFPIFRS